MTNGQTMERYGMPLVQAVIVCLLSWNGYAILTLRDSVARLEERYSALLTVVTSGIDDRYRRSDSIRDFANAAEHRKELERRVEALERLLVKR